MRRERERKARKSMRRSKGQLNDAGFRPNETELPSSPTAAASSKSTAGDKHVWNTAAWLEQIGVAEIVAQALLWPLMPEGSDVATPEEQLGFLRLLGGFDDPAAIRQLLSDAPTKLMDSLAAAVLQSAQRLKVTDVASGNEMHEKYALKSFE